MLDAILEAWRAHDAINLFMLDEIPEADFQEVRGPVGLLFQDPDDQLFCPTVAEDVAFGPLNAGLSRGEVRRIVARTLELLGLAGAPAEGAMPTAKRSTT